MQGRSQSGDKLIPSPTPRIAEANNVKLKEAKIRDLERLRAKSKTLGGGGAPLDNFCPPLKHCPAL